MNLEDVQIFFSWVSENPSSLFCLIPLAVIAICVLGFLIVAAGGMADSMNE